jgi:uncharacterized membrane protein
MLLDLYLRLWGRLVALDLVDILLLIKAGRTLDSYPYILLNLVVSMLADVQAPIILMSQNREA